MIYTRDEDNYITNRALELIAEGHSESSAAKIISKELEQEISRSTIHGRVYRRKLSSGLEEKPRPSMPYFTKYAPYFLKTAPPEPKVDYDFSRGDIKIAVLNDLHCPFQNEEALEWALQCNKAADIVITSEVADMYSLTSFGQDKHASFEFEVEEIIRWFEYLSESFPVTYVVASGHEKRLSRYVTSRIKTDLLFLIETDIIKLLARPFSNVITIDECYHPINDAIFTHLDKHSATIPMRSAAKSHEWLQSWKSVIGVEDYRVLVQAHGHHSGVINFPNVQLVESGCFQKIPSWVMRKLPLLPWVWGYAAIYQHDGVTDLNATEVCVYSYS